MRAANTRLTSRGRNERAPLNADFAVHGYQATQSSDPEDGGGWKYSLARPVKQWARAFFIVTYVIWFVGLCVQSNRHASLLAAYPPTPVEYDAYKARWDVESASHKHDYDEWAHERAVFE